MSAEMEFRTRMVESFEATVIEIQSLSIEEVYEKFVDGCGWGALFLLEFPLFWDLINCNEV